jgi:hypothetical protein
LQELAEENERLTSALGAHGTLKAIYSDSNQPAGVRVKAAAASLPHERPRLLPEKAPMDLVAEEIEPEPLVQLVDRQRARADRLLSEPPFRDLPKVIRFWPNGNGGGNSGNGDDSSD